MKKKKKVICIIGSPTYSEKIKKRWWERQTHIRRVFSIFPVRTRLFAATCALYERKKERNDEEKKIDERNAVASPARNRTLPNAEEEGRDRERTQEGITVGHPRCPPALTRRDVTQSRCEFVVSQFVGRHRCATSCNMTRGSWHWKCHRVRSRLYQNSLNF